VEAAQSHAMSATTQEDYREVDLCPVEGEFTKELWKQRWSLDSRSNVRLRFLGDERLVGGCRLQGLLTEHAPFPVITAAPMAEFPARLDDRRSRGGSCRSGV
jgi:hypothetical protein